MTNIALFLLLSLIGAFLVFGGIKSDGKVSLICFVIGALLLIPGVYGLFTSIL